MSEKRKFVKGLNPLKVKSSGSSKQLSKAKELERRKAAEEEAAAVLNEYVEEHQVRAGGKTFVRAGIQNPDKSEANVPIKTEDSTNGAIYKPKSKMQQLAEEFQKSKAVSEDYKASKDIGKKKLGEKKKSNLELFKEELEKTQQERDIRRKIKKGDLSGISEDTLNALPPTFFKPKTTEEMPYQYGSKDTGDASTTNLFVSNLNPKMNEEQLCRVFGKYGPLASVKIMWPRTEDEKQKNRNCGFVAFMSRADGERALADIEGKDVMDYEMKLGWGKAVPIPPIPVYIHPSHSNAVKPPKQSGFPFNCQLPYKMRKEGKEFDGNLENTVVKVVMPTERTILSLINRVVEFVVREGPMFEAMIMNREIQNPLFRFLFDNKSNEHIYYRWRIFSLLQGDTVNKWQPGCFRMFVGGSIWQPPSMNPFHNMSGNTSSLTASALLASNSASNMHGPMDAAASLALKKNLLLEQLLKESRGEDKETERDVKKALSDRQRDKLEDLLRTITTDRTKVGELMRWAIDHAENSEEIVECICESLSILETPIPTKVARLYVVSDILHNSSAKVRQASSFRKHFQDNLLETMEHLHKALSTCSTKSQQEKFRKQVLSCLAAWQDWSLYPPNYLINLQNVFVGISTSENVKAEEENAKNKTDNPDDNDGNLLDDDIDGIAIYDEDVDGVAIGDPDIDGIPLKKDDEETGLPKSRWETDDPLSKSRWEQADDGKSTEIETSQPDEKPKFKPGKWQKVEGVKEGQNTDKNDESKRSKSRSKSRSPSKGGDDSDRRRFLRDVELKVMRFVDKLEQKGASRSGLNIQKEAEKFRQQLIDEYDQSRSRKSKPKQKRGRASSRSPSDSKRRKTSRRRSSSGSDDKEFKKSKYILGDSPTSYSPPSRRRSFSRSPKRRGSLSRSPLSRRRSFSRSPRHRSFSNSPPRRRNSRSPIFSDRSRSPLSSRFSPRRDRRSMSFSPRRSPSPRSPPRYARTGRSPSPPSYSPRRSSGSKSSKKKKSKKAKK